MDYSVNGSGGWGQLLVRVKLTVKIVVQYALRRATNLSEVLPCHKKIYFAKKINFYIANALHNVIY